MIQETLIVRIEMAKMRMRGRKREWRNCNSDENETVEETREKVLEFCPSDVTGGERLMLSKTDF